MSTSNCQRCSGRGVVLVDIRRIDNGGASTTLLTAGCRAVRDTEGRYLGHELVCPQCDGKRTHDDQQATPLGRTYGELYGPAMQITDQGEADRYFAELVRIYLEDAPADSRERAEEVQRVNLGYYAGYYDPETRARVERLFRCAHPIFGAIAERGQRTPEESFQAGLRAGRAFAGEG